MKSRRFLDSRVGYLFASIVTLLGIAAPAFSSVSVGASGLVTGRKITLSSSAINATAVDYELKFTPTSAAGAVVVDFCDDSPIIGQTCTAPTGLDLTTATSSPAGVTDSGSALFLTTSVSAGVEKTITFSGITNPSYVTNTDAHKGFYARIQTYTDGTVAAAQHTAAATPGTYIDAGGIAMAITNPIQVSAAVRETMTFCVSALKPGPSCGKTGQAPTTPSLELGHGTPKALDSTATDTADAWTQISTNAISGAVVNMKSNKACGGLHRVGESDPDVCGIAPVATGHDPISLGVAALFGLNVGDKDTTISGSSGDITKGSSYGTAGEYGMNWVSGNATGVSSPYGDTIYDTAGAPIDNIGVPLTFAATVTNSTAAGLYQADLNLIATGTY